MADAMHSIRQLAAQEALQLNPLEAAHVRYGRLDVRCNLLTSLPISDGMD
jgi:hypothetical protein